MWAEYTEEESVGNQLQRAMFAVNYFELFTNLGWITALYFWIGLGGIKCRKI